MTAVPVLVDLSDLDIEDSATLARKVGELRARAAREPLRLLACPQLLAHTLYRAGLLVDGSIRVESMRDEEPYG